jgi:hypothetical protein
MASSTPVRRPWTAVLARWPTALALGTATLTLDDVESDEEPVGLAVRRLVAGRDTVRDRLSLDQEGWEIDGYGNVDCGA